MTDRALPLIDPTAANRQREILMELEEIKRRLDRMEQLLSTINLRLAAGAK